MARRTSSQPRSSSTSRQSPSGGRAHESAAAAPGDLREERIEWLRELFPEAVVEGEIDLVRLRAALGVQEDGPAERFTFSWAGRRNALQMLQMPSRATLVPAQKESINFDTSQNLFVEGDNLEVLKLLYKPYFGRVKMIYIDPPYNTGSDFVYPDNYADPLDAYLVLTAQKAANGDLLTSNPETSGRFHSSWLSMMYPRLFLARQLLHEAGVIWVSIDDVELAQLRLICNEIFGEENFVATFIWEKRTTRENRRVFSFNHDYIVCYAKDKEKFQAARKLLPLSDSVLKRYGNPDDDPRGEWQSVSLNVQAGHATPSQFYTITTPSGRDVPPPAGRAWSVTRERMQELIDDSRVWFGTNGNNVPRLKVFLSEAREGLTPHTLWRAQEVGTNDSAKKALIELFDGIAVYETPKPVELIKRILHISTSNNDLVMDFFAGTCTTAQAVAELNREDGGSRRFIMVELPEPTPENSEARKAGYETTAEIGKERMRRVIAKAAQAGRGSLDVSRRTTPEDLAFRVFKLAESQFKRWRGVEKQDPDAYLEQMAIFADPLVADWKPESVIWEVAIKEGYSSTSRVALVSAITTNKVWCVTDPEKEQSFLVCLDDEFKLATAKKLDLGRADLLICRDSALSDELAANLALQCHLKAI